MGIFKKTKDTLSATGGALAKTTKDIPKLPGFDELEIPMPKLSMSVRLSIVSLLTWLILVTSTAIMVTYYLGARSSAKFLVDNLMSSMVDRMIDKSLDYLGTASVVSELSEKLTSNKVLTANNQDKLVRYFKEIVKVNPSFSNVFFGSKNGNFTMVKRQSDGTFSVRKISRKGGAKEKWKHAAKKWGTKYPNKAGAGVYDPRKRSWYKKAAKKKKLVWTNVYIFDSDKKPGITCAVPVFSKGRRLEGVIGIDIGLVELSYFLGDAKISERGKAFIFTNKNELLALPAKRDQNLDNLVEKYEKKGVTKYRLTTIDKSPVGEIQSSYEAIKKLRTKQKKKKFKKLRKMLKRKRKGPIHFRFKHDGDEFVGMYASYPRSTPWNWKIGVIVPESSFLDRVQKTNLITLIVAIVLVIAAVFVGYFVAGRVSDPLSHLAIEMEKISRFDLSSKKEIKSGIKEVQDMIINFVKMKYGLGSFQKFVPADLVRDLIETEHEATLGGERRSLTVHFSDIKGFTSVSEKISAEELVELLGEYLGEMSRIITEHMGTLDKYIGDAVMAFWGAPRPVDNHAEMACRASLECQKKLAEMADDWEKKGRPVFRARIGLNTGEMIVGNMGSEERLNYTVIGDAVNLGARLEPLNDRYGTWITIGENTYEIVKDKFETRHLDWVAVKGKDQAVAVYELIAEKGDISDDHRTFRDAYEAGLYLYKDRKWDEAIASFEKALKIRPDEMASTNMIVRINEFKASPPPDGWQGELVMKTK